MSCVFSLKSRLFCKSQCWIGSHTTQRSPCFCLPTIGIRVECPHPVRFAYSYILFEKQLIVCEIVPISEILLNDKTVPCTVVCLPDIVHRRKDKVNIWIKSNLMYHDFCIVYLQSPKHMVYQPYLSIGPISVKDSLCVSVSVFSLLLFFLLGQCHM